MGNVTGINELQIKDTNKAQRQIYLREQRHIMLWVNQIPKFVDYYMSEFMIDLTEVLKEPIEKLEGKQLELDALIDGLGE